MNYLNKYTERYEEAIINEHITAWDVMKICSLNGIRPEIGTGWYPMVINLFIELDKRGWNRRVSCIKEKFAELTVYLAQDTTLTNKEDWRALREKYELASKFTCETCGKFGRVRDRDTWQYTACREHYHMSEQRMEAYDTFLFVKEGKRRWSELRKVEMELDYFERPRFLRLEFSRGVFVYLRSSDFGFGRLIARIPQHVRHHFDATVLEKYAEGAYCQVCGIQSYYNHTCEACEFTTFSYCSPDHMASYTVEEIKEYQLEWLSRWGRAILCPQQNLSLESRLHQTRQC